MKTNKQIEWEVVDYDPERYNDQDLTKEIAYMVGQGYEVHDLSTYVTMTKVYKPTDLNGYRSDKLGIGDKDELIHHNVTRIIYRK